MVFLQAYVHGDEGSAEDKQQDGHINDAGRVSRRSEDPRGILESGPQQVNPLCIVFQSRLGVVIFGHGTTYQ